MVCLVELENNFTDQNDFGLFPKGAKTFTNLNDILIEPFFSVSDLVYQLLQNFFLWI